MRTTRTGPLAGPTLTGTLSKIILPKPSRRVATPQTVLPPHPIIAPLNPQSQMEVMKMRRARILIGWADSFRGTNKRTRIHL